MKKEKKKENSKLIYLSIICITIILIVGLVMFFNYQKEQLKQNQENERLKQEQDDRDYYRKQLTDCINNAKTSRSNLWSSNCPDNNPNCSLNSNVVEWIDERYQQEVSECNMKWGQ